MLIVLGAYFGIVWLVFSKPKLLPWSGLWKSLVYGIAVLIALVVIGALNHTTPTGTVSVQGAVIQIKPNVGGTVTSIAVQPNEHVRQGDVLFSIDSETQRADVAIAEAGLGWAGSSQGSSKAASIRSRRCRG